VFTGQTMTTLRSAINTLLNADDVLMGILTGGIHDSTEISRSATPSAYDDRGDLKPCAVLRMGTASGRPPFDDAADEYVYLYFYQKPGSYASIDSAMSQAYTTLHCAALTIDPGWVCELRWGNDLGDSWDDALGAPMNYSRYKATTVRRDRLSAY